ncbi:hypothetical protein Pmani_039302 [Petrolisthes manimaculis]|uniref:Uncharacterized protein n=1 Tax=Petrolisthes manimaculis TaxID=1843537 RepID=A0AAE1TLH1_9EUCA|nr:hypothetical protein Pmani_039302 [Petrolisthes manimaculis]
MARAPQRSWIFVRLVSTCSLIAFASSLRSVRIATNSHRQYSLHADCWSPDVFDPEACPACAPWVLDLQTYPPEARTSLDSYALLRKAWTRARKIRVKHGFEPTWRNPTLGTSLAILRQRTISSERPPSDPLPALESEREEEDAAPVHSPSPSPPPGPPYFASSPSAHKSRESPKRDSKDRREKRKRRDKDTSSSTSSRRRKSRSSTPRVSREEASSLSSRFKDLVNSLPDMFNQLLEARFPHTAPPSVSSFNQSGSHTLPEIDPVLPDSRPPSPDPTLPSALEQNQASAPDQQPLTTPAPATATTAVATPAPAQASHVDRTSPVPSTSASTPEGATLQFLPVTWTTIPKSSLFNKKATSSIIAAQPPIINISAATPKPKQRFPSKNSPAASKTPAQANHRQPFPISKVTRHLLQSTHE